MEMLAYPPGVLPPLLRKDPRQEGQDKVDAPGHYVYRWGRGQGTVPKVSWTSQLGKDRFAN